MQNVAYLLLGIAIGMVTMNLLTYNSSEYSNKPRFQIIATEGKFLRYDIHSGETHVLRLNDWYLIEEKRKGNKGDYLMNLK